METPVTAGFWLSPQQKHVWALQQDGGTLRSVCQLRVDRSLTESAVLDALRSLIARQEILRTVYLRQPGMKYPFQAVLDQSEPSLRTLDLTGLSEVQQNAKLDELVQEEQVAVTLPDSSRILSAVFVILGAEQHDVVFSVPALTADAAGLRTLTRDLLRSLDGQALEAGEEPLRYVQFAQWQNELIDSDDENSRKAKGYWEEASAEATALSLPHELRAQQARKEETLHRSLDAKTAESVRAATSQLQASEAEVLFSVWQCVLWRLTGQSTFRVGLVSDSREYEELRDAVGLLAKTLPVQARFEGDLRFREVVEHVHSEIERVKEWQEYYVPGRGFVEPPVSFEFTSDSSNNEGRVWVCNESYKLLLSVASGTTGIDLVFRYDRTRISGLTAERIAGYFTTLLAAAVANPEANVSRLPMLAEKELRQLTVEWNQTAAEYPQDKCLHELFESQAGAAPDRPALRFHETQLTYRELNERANQIAHYLRSLGVGPDVLVGLCVERSANTIVALLGVLKAGGAFVPLNPDNPKPRALQQLAGVKVLLTEESLLEQIPSFEGKVLCLDRDARLWSEQPKINPENHTKPDNLVYVIYTSGSTGVPKGVAVRHRNLVNYSHFITRRLRVDEHPQGLHFATVSTIAADLGNTCIYPALISGGCLHVIGYDVSTDAERMADYNARYPLDVLKIVPSHVQALLQTPHAKGILPHRFLLLGGEIFTPKLAEHVFSLQGTCEVLNHYGPTETTVGSLTLRVAEFDWRNSETSSIPIGRPIANTQIFILDSQLQLVPTGAVGELYIAGEGVTAGYLNQPEKTAERFVRNPFSSSSESRMYRTGDLARYLVDGNVEFLGRADDQVKIRGFRIELGEIEAALMSKPGVKQAVILAVEQDTGEKRLVAYVVIDQSMACSADDLRALLKRQLPEYMVPSMIVLLPRIPLNPNGKIDRKALPAPETVQAREFVAPKIAEEEKVAKIWQEVFRRERISTDDNFFDLGGHSLMATQVISRIREQFHLELPIRTMFEHPTIAGLAKAIAEAAETPSPVGSPAIVRVSREAYRAGRNPAS
jgi:amino acid adenylation domain-containing protein